MTHASSPSTASQTSSSEPQRGDVFSVDPASLAPFAEADLSALAVVLAQTDADKRAGALQADELGERVAEATGDAALAAALLVAVWGRSDKDEQLAPLAVAA